jgi:hypothetical protein
MAWFRQGAWGVVVIDFEIDSLLDDGDVEDLLLVSMSFATMPHGFGFCEFGADYGGFAGGAVGSTAIAASALRQVARESGYPLSDDVLKILLGHAAFESGFGRGDPAKNTLANTNNYGSVQATADWVRANLGKPGFGAVAHQDSDPKKGPFVGWYRVYPNSVEGARGFFNTVKPAITTDIDQYAANLYHRGYYGGTTTDPQKAIAAYATAIRHAMPSAAPSDSPASIAAAQAFSVGPLAPVANRMTAKYKVDGKVKWPASPDDAKHAWDSSWSSPGAYGLNALGKAIDFGSVMATDGVVWLGDPPKGFAAAGRGAIAWLPIAGIVIGGVAGLPWRIAGALIGSVIGGSLGYFAEKLPFVTGLLALSASPALGSGEVPKSNAAILAAPGTAPPDLKVVQSRLNILGMASPPLKVDGIMGPKTTAAITKFQKSKGIMATGILDVATIKALS